MSRLDRWTFSRMVNRVTLSLHTFDVTKILKVVLPPPPSKQCLYPVSTGAFPEILNYNVKASCF